MTTHSIETLRTVLATVDSLVANLGAGKAKAKAALDAANSALAPLGIEVKRQKDADALARRLGQIGDAVRADLTKAENAQAVAESTKAEVAAHIESERAQASKPPRRQTKAEAAKSRRAAQAGAGEGDETTTETVTKTKAERAAALLSGEAKPAVRATKTREPARKEVTVAGTVHSTKRLGRVLRRLSIADRAAVIATLGVTVTGMRNRDANRVITNALDGRAEMPEQIQAAIDLANARQEPKGARGPKEGSRIAFMIELLKRENGVTVDEIADAMLAQFPKLSARHGHADATRERYVTFARTCLAHLQHGRAFSEAKVTKGRIDASTRRENRTVYRLAAQA